MTVPYQWISCKHYMPIVSEEVIACIGHGQLLKRASVDDNNHWHFVKPQNITQPVTHWCRYLPTKEATSVHDKLPDVDIPVIIYFGTTHDVAKRNIFDRWTSIDGRMEYLHLPVTHWAELPSFPKN